MQHKTTYSMAHRHGAMGPMRDAPDRGHDEPGLLFRTLLGAMRLVLPVAAYVVTLVAAWELRAVPADWFDEIAASSDALRPSLWLTQGHVLLPAVFLLNNLVNRRYGMDYALWHVAISWTLLTMFVIAAALKIDPRLPAIGLPAAQEVGAFAGGLIAAHIMAAFVFDRTRGIVWWTAPLYSALVGGLIFVLVFYFVAQPGGEHLWLNRMATDAGVKFAMAFLMLIPYWLLRPIIRPMPGFGGY